jgi:arsenate reductase (thioredoxin)
MRALILCTGNSCRSQMALGWMRHLYGASIEAFSAGSQPADRVHPLAIAAMREVGIDISREQPKHLSIFLEQSFDRVITVCDTAAEACPVFPGKAVRYHRDFADPAKASGSPYEQMAVFWRVRDDLKTWIMEIMNDPG